MSPLALTTLAVLLAQKPAACDSVSTCVAELRCVADDSAGVSTEEDAVSDRLRALGPEAVDVVIDLLDDPDGKIRDLAGYTVAGMKPLEPRHFEPIRRALLGGNGWVARALATIGIPEAMDLLMQRLVATRERAGPISFALAKFDQAAVPGLVDLFRCRTNCDVDLLVAARAVLQEMSERAQHEAAGPLAAVAGDASMPWESRVRVLQTLACLGRGARPAIPELLTLTRSENGEIRKAARNAVLQIGGEATEEVLIALLQEPGSKLWTVRDIASHGPSASAVGPHIERLLDSRSPDERVAAARALGFIDYSEAAPSLIAALHDDADWRLVYAAADSLGRLRVKEAKDALEATAEGHWYPPVREAARLAVRRIDGVEALPSVSEDAFKRTFFDHEDVPDRHGFCEALPSAPVVPRRVRRFRQTDEPTLARSLSYDIVSHQRRSPVVPDVGVRLSGGWLVGSDSGEWGGELMFRSDRGPVELVTEGNIVDIQLVGRSTLVAIGGLAHLTMNAGAVYRIERDAGRWRAVWWRELPGAPETAWPIAGNQLLIVARGGSIVLSPDGTMALAPCHPARRD